MSEFDLIYKLDLSNEEKRKIVKEYGSVTEFCNRYIKYMQGENVRIRIPKSVEQALTNYFDLSNAYCIGENSGVAKLTADILGIRPGFATYGPIKDIIDETVEEVLSEQDRDIVRALYNLDGKNRTIDELIKFYGMTQREILLRKQRGVKRISAGMKSGRLRLLSRLIVDGAIADDVLPELIEIEDAIVETRYDKPNQRKALMVEKVLSREIDYIAFTGDLSYIVQGLEIKTKISNSILSDEKKNELVNRVSVKISEIAKFNRDRIISIFKGRIDSFKQDEKAYRRYRSLEKDIYNSGLEDDSIEMILNQLPKINQERNNNYGSLKRKFILRIRFPQLDLPIDQIVLRDKSIEAFSKSGLVYIGNIICYSKKELVGFANISGLHVDEIFDALESMGYDIPEDDTIPIDIYNYDKIYGDSFSKVAEDIQNTDIDDESKSNLIDEVLDNAIKKLEHEYEELGRLISTYTDIFKTHEQARLETADEERYRRKIKEAEEKRVKIKEKIENLIR